MARLTFVGADRDRWVVSAASALRHFAPAALARPCWAAAQLGR
jgi:hypothetical protein